MAFSLTTATRNGIASYVESQLEVGAGNASLEIQNAIGTVLATFNLGAAPFGAPVGGVMSLAGVPLEATVASSGTATKYRIKNRNGSVEITGDPNSVDTAAGAGIDIILSSVSLNAGDIIRITSLTYTVGNA